MKIFKKRLCALLVMIVLVNTLLSPPSTVSAAATPIMNNYIKVNSVTVNKSTSTVTLKYTILQKLPNLTSIYMKYSYGISRLSGGSTLLKSTKGTYTKELKITDYHCTIDVNLYFNAYKYNETKFLTSYFVNTKKLTSYHTVTAAEAGGMYIAVSAANVYLTYTPQKKAVEIVSKVAMWAGLGAGFAEVTGLWNGVWQPKKGNYMKIVTYFKNNQYCQDTYVWANKESYNKGVTATKMTTKYNIP